VAGGLGIAAACDFLIAAEGARFGIPEAWLGLAPSILLPVLASRIGQQRARALALRAASFDAGEAERIGLVDQVAPLESVDSEVAALVSRLSRMSPGALRELRGHATELPSLPFEAALEAGCTITARRLGDPEFRSQVKERLWLED
jgi:methylglutaconyl-CoA hydratase